MKMTALSKRSKSALIVLCTLLLASRPAFGDSKEALFGNGEETHPANKTSATDGSEKGNLRGFVQFELARTIDEPVHWSKLRMRSEIGRQGSIDKDIKWKVSLRLDYDAVFALEDYYPPEVARNQRATASLRETYLDVNAGDWDFRIGRQQIVWGEMIGLFFADVVSARDLREFILPEFEMLRTPQWAVRAEHFQGDFHGELLWIPLPTYDEIGKPGAEFYPYQAVLPGFSTIYRNEVKPALGLAKGNFGLRASFLRSGWDLSGFVYRSMDVQPTFYRQVIGTTAYFQPRHERINQIGATLTKDFGSVVLKAEGVYTRGRKFGVLDPADADGLVAQNTLDWAAGLDFSLTSNARFNVQLFQRVFYAHDPRLMPEKHENGYSLYLNTKLGNRWEAQAIFISSLNRTDWLFRPRLQWNFEKNWRLLAGFDLFKGPPAGLFGQFENHDRFYSEIRYSF
jgi:hypothetical protein